MNRADYSDDYDNWQMIKWRGQVASSIRGRRGQAFLKELLDELDAMPVKRLIDGSLRTNGECCTLGVIGQKRGLDLTSLQDDGDNELIAKELGIAEPLVREIEYLNDECGFNLTGRETPEERWKRMRAWVAEQLTPNRGTQGDGVK